ncbi:MAG TPA: alanine--tRNA ligase-related protein [Candidatus Nanoarchaeia archaeon]|nr:alanine--tRNA ligase-related protein [Candidatus Nanoarchaeia archaeon]
MESTELLYLEDLNILDADAQVLDIYTENNINIVILNRTSFYPQGGGQPCDTGIIESKSSTFVVNEVKTENGIVRHIGIFVNGFFNKDELVTCKINKERRLLLSRLHSAGHVIDMAINNLDIGWKPGRAYHFPEGPYVEYFGILDATKKDLLRKDIENESNNIVRTSLKTTLRFVSKQELMEICGFIPDYITNTNKIRVIMFGNFGIPCGGTHVVNLREINKIIIRKIKINQGGIRVAYEVDA